MLIVLVVVIAGVVGYFALVKNHEPVTQQTTTPPPVTTQAPAPEIPTATPTPVDETVNWKIYRSEKYGFEVKYPPTWDLPYPDDGSDIHLASSPAGERGQKPGEVVVEIQAFHTKPSNVDLLSFIKSNFLAKEGELGASGELTKTNLYGLSVIKVEHAGGEGPDGPRYFIEKGSDKFFYILVYGKAYKQMVSKIISTIKFVK